MLQGVRQRRDDRALAREARLLLAAQLGLHVLLGLLPVRVRGRVRRRVRSGLGLGLRVRLGLGVGFGFVLLGLLTDKRDSALLRGAVRRVQLC